MLIYLDNCSFNRPFDEQQQLRVRLETETKLFIQEQIIQKKIKLAWSYILDFENEMNPFEQRKFAISVWKTYAAINIDETSAIIGTAQEIIKFGIKSKDALHLACAMSAECKYLITTDDLLIKKSFNIKGITIIDPINFIIEEFA
jgi:predicted nucleic acid-binding protein